MKPSDIYVGAIDLFSVVIPGAILSAYLEAQGADGWLKPFALVGDSKARGWLAFIVASYVLGHFLFFSAAQLDRIADAARKTIWKDDGARISAGERKLSFFGVKEDSKAPMNTFTWAKARVHLGFRDAAGELARYEADQKFFRSLSLLAFGIAVHQFVMENWRGGALCLALAAGAFVRFVERRHKSVQWAYFYVLAGNASTSSGAGDGATTDKQAEAAANG